MTRTCERSDHYNYTSICVTGHYDSRRDNALLRRLSKSPYVEWHWLPVRTIEIIGTLASNAKYNADWDVRLSCRLLSTATHCIIRLSSYVTRTRHALLRDVLQKLKMLWGLYTILIRQPGDNVTCAHDADRRSVDDVIVLPDTVYVISQGGAAALCGRNVTSDWQIATEQGNRLTPSVCWSTIPLKFSPQKTRITENRRCAFRDIRRRTVKQRQTSSSHLSHPTRRSWQTWLLRVLLNE